MDPFRVMDLFTTLDTFLAPKEVWVSMLQTCRKLYEHRRRIWNHLVFYIHTPKALNIGGFTLKDIPNVPI